MPSNDARRVRGWRACALGALCVVVAGLASATSAIAGPADLDPSFSGDGVETTGFGSDSAVNAVARQADGKLVAVGARYSGRSEIAVARFDADGSLDASFSGDGVATIPFGSTATGNDVALQGDRIVVAGHTGTTGDFALARLNTDGSPDTSFSEDGLQTTDFGGNDVANAVAVTATGRIVAVGGSDSTVALARYADDGSPDTTFSEDGKQTSTFNSVFGATDVVLQPNGKIVVSGDDSFDFAVARYNADGSPDASFDTDGVHVVAPFGTNSSAESVAFGVTLQPDGGIVAVGWGVATGFSNRDLAVARFDPDDGALDTTFSGDGKDINGITDEATDVAVQGGKIVVVGKANTGVQDFAVARYNVADGSPAGTQTTDFAGGEDVANAVAPLPDGTFIAAGKTVEAGAVTGRFALARYAADGSLDTSFSGDGKQTTEIPGGVSDANALALQGDGKIVAVGGAAAGDAGTEDFALARYVADGTPDPSFSGDGRQTTDFGGADRANAVALQGDGKIVVAGRSIPDSFSVARYNADGSLDTTFSEDGMQRTTFANGGGNTGNGVAIQPDGKIVVAGTSDQEFAVARYNADGSPDTSFSDDGKLTTPLLVIASAYAVVVQPDGMILVAGEAAGTGSFAGEMAFVRYTPEGARDNSFSGDGLQGIDFGGEEEARAVALQPDGKIVAVGTRIGSSGDTFVRTRLNADGSLDPSFGGTTDFGADSGASAVVVQGDGRIVAAGHSGSDAALARFNPDGSLDTSFAGDGTQVSDFGGEDRIAGLALQADGKLVAAGVGGTTPSMLVARYGDALSNPGPVPPPGPAPPTGGGPPGGGGPTPPTSGGSGPTGKAKASLSGTPTTSRGVSFVVTMPARGTAKIVIARAGRSAGRSALPAAKFRRIGTVRVKLKKGRNVVRVKRVKRRKLARGSYRATITPKVAGKALAPLKVKFRIRR